mgnify:CR=1 FL=1
MLLRLGADVRRLWRASVTVRPRTLGVRASVTVRPRTLGVRASMPVRPRTLGVRASMPVTANARACCLVTVTANARACCLAATVRPRTSDANICARCCRHILLSRSARRPSITITVMRILMRILMSTMAHNGTSSPLNGNGGWSGEIDTNGSDGGGDNGGGGNGG